MKWDERWFEEDLGFRGTRKARKDEILRTDTGDGFRCPGNIYLIPADWCGGGRGVMSLGTFLNS
jgi:hypothetical protein